MRRLFRNGINVLWISVLFAVSSIAQSPVGQEIESEIAALNDSSIDNSRVLQDSLLQFENRIRPILIQHCYECHSSGTEAAGGLLLDNRDALRAGGDSGPSILVGDADQSLLIRAMGYNDPNLQMPPTGKLDERIVADFRTWIEQGAVDPRNDSLSRNEISSMVGSNLKQAATDPIQHWAYRPLPAAQDLEFPLDLPPGRVTDAYIDRQLAEKELVAAGPSKTDVLARRLTFDLTGLPPTIEQLAITKSVDSHDGLEVLVDQLLSSPHYGESMARRWMDVVRYADSITLRGFILPNAWRYRDYLISAFNEDRSFETMIHEQVAGDLLDSSNIHQRQQQLIATAFLSLGNTNLEEQDKQQLEMDYLDEQLDVLGAVFLGQTLGCARCHDHKFDPISTKDYYAMAGILRSSSGMKHANVSEWIELPLPLDEPQKSYFEGLEQRQQSLQEQLAILKKRLDASQKQADKIPVSSLPGVVVDNKHAKLVGQWVSSKHTHPLVGDDYFHDANQSRGEKSATFEPVNLVPGEYEVRLSYQAGSNRSSRVNVKVFSADGDSELQIDQRMRPPEEGLWISLGKYRFEPNGQSYVLVSNQDADGHVVVDAVQFLPIGQSVSVAKLEGDAPRAEETNQTDRAIETQHLKQSISRTEKELSAVVTAIKERPKYLTILESGSAVDLPVHIRGSVHSLGEVVPRGFPTSLKSTGIDASPSQPGSDTSHSQPTSKVEPASSAPSRPNRLDFAKWIAAPDNPLTARVYVNRIWLWLMGRGLVDTPNNFGTTGENPSHPEFLDWLAVRFIHSGWSTKAIVREIVSSRAYQRSSAAYGHPSISLDPENRSYCRGNMRRLSAESLRDSMLILSGELDRTAGGSIIDIEAKNDFDYLHRTARRSIYHPVFRNSLPELFEQFDFADPSSSIGKRARSTHALQDLGLSNNAWVIQRSQQAALRWSQRASQAGIETAINELWVVSFGRQALEEEVQVCLEFLIEQPQDSHNHLTAWESLVQSLVSSLDFRFLE